MAEKNSGKGIPWSHLANPLAYGFKKNMLAILQERYMSHDDLLDRLAAHQLVTTDDYKRFSDLVADIYELGYLRAIKDHKDQLDKLGIQATIVPPKPKKQDVKLFPQSEKSG